MLCPHQEFSCFWPAHVGIASSFTLLKVFWMDKTGGIKETVSLWGLEKGRMAFNPLLSPTDMFHRQPGSSVPGGFYVQLGIEPKSS